jgi:hypothetical protein
MRTTLQRRALRGLLGLIIVALALGTEPALALKILEPAELSTLKAGQTVNARVDIGQDTGVVAVRYYWYSESGETLVEQEQSKSAEGAAEGRLAEQKPGPKDSEPGSHIVALSALSATALSEPPFGGALPVPREAVGTMRLLAVGEISRGRLGTRTIFDEILVKVEPEAQLVSIEFETEKPWRLGRTGQLATYGQVDTMGKIFELPVVGLFSDGVTRPISSPSTGTTYKSTNEKVIKVHQPSGLLQLVGDGQTTLTVANRGKQESLDVIVEVGGEPNQPPIADAGDSRTVKAGKKVELNGLRSRDPEGEALYYSWSQVRGAKVPLLDVHMPKASFTAPQVSEKRLYRFKLRVTDKKGADGLPAFVDVYVEP